MAADPHPSGFHPRSRFALATLSFGLAAGPLPWFIQLVVNYALDSNACYRQGFPRVHSEPGWQWAGSGRFAINIGAILLAFVASAVSLQIWREMRQSQPSVQDDVLPPAIGRTRFLAASGVMIGLGSLAAIVFVTIALVVVPACPG